MVERPVLNESKAYRKQVGGRGYVYHVGGEVRWTTSQPTDHVSLFNLFDGVARTLDLEDGSTAFTAIMSRLTFKRDIERPRIIEYLAIFLEQDNPS